MSWRRNLAHFRVGENIFIIQTHVLKALVFYRKLLFSAGLHLNSLCGLPKRVHSLHFSCLHQKTSSCNVWMKSRTVLGMALGCSDFCICHKQLWDVKSKRLAGRWILRAFNIWRREKNDKQVWTERAKKKFQICSEYIFSSVEGSNFQKLTTC